MWLSNELVLADMLIPQSVRNIPRYLPVCILHHSSCALHEINMLNLWSSTMCLLTTFASATVTINYCFIRIVHERFILLLMAGDDIAIGDSCRLLRLMIVIPYSPIMIYIRPDIGIE